ncbi:MAG: response regulator [Planctomycetota bacterium]
MLSSKPFLTVMSISSNTLPDSPTDEAPLVYLVDDQQVELDLMQRWCERGRFRTKTFDRPENFFDAIDPETVGCVVADLRMPNVSGLELQRNLIAQGIQLPVILVTGHGDAENCRAAFHQGVFDFIEKGFDAEQFLESIERAVRKNRRDRFRNQVRHQASKLLRLISPREHDVMMLLAGGATLKTIAQELNISVQTASKHRMSIFQKLQIDNEVDLYKMLLAADIDLDNVQLGHPNGGNN